MLKRDKYIWELFCIAVTFALVWFTIPEMVFGQRAKIFINKVVIDETVYFKPLPNEIIIESTSSITFYYSVSSRETEKKTLYNITLNGTIIKPTYNKNSVSFNNLAEGIYTLVIEEYSEDVLSANSATKKFIVRNKSHVVRGDPDDSSNSLFLIILIAAVVIQLIVIIVLLSQRKAPEQTVEKESIEKINSLKENYKILKHSYDALDKRNKELKSRIKKLTKVTFRLEEANLKLMEQKEALEQKKIYLEDLGKKKDELVAMAVHDIKNPAQAIQGMAELLEVYDYTAKEQQQIMETIILSSESIVSLAQEISETFAKQDFEESIKLETASLKDIIDSVASLNFTYAHKKKIRLVNNSSDAIPKFMFDPFKIKEALDNIISNAVKYSPVGTEVTIKSYFTNTKVTIEVTDTGVGIPEEELKHIFDKGVKLSPKPTGGEKSSGLGLWIVKKIIDEHEGTVWAESKVSKGTTIRFDIPFKT